MESLSFPWKDLVLRAAWTFAQAAVAVLLVADQPLSKVAIVAALAAGLSAVKTFVRETL